MSGRDPQSVTNPNEARERTTHCQDGAQPLKLQFFAKLLPSVV